MAPGKEVCDDNNIKEGIVALVVRIVFSESALRNGITIDTNASPVTRGTEAGGVTFVCVLQQGGWALGWSVVQRVR